MSPIGRIFVVINLALAGLFLGWAASNLATAQQYKSEFTASEKAKSLLESKLSKEIADLEGQRAEAERLRTEAIQARDNAKAAKDAAELDLASATDQLSEARANSSNWDNAVGDMSNTLEGLASQVSTLEKRASDADEARHEAELAQAAAEAERQAALDQVNGLTDTIAQLQTDLKSTRDEAMSLDTQMKIAMEKYGFGPEQIGQSAPKIDGSVQDVSMDLGKGLVFINRGTNDQVKKGYLFDIFQGLTYKGRARVEIVNATTCTARIVDTVPGTTIQQGDRASTQI